MIFSSGTEHAMRGLSEMAARGTQGRVMVEELAARVDVPRDFLAKVFQRLARAGILASAKGRGGGFALARPAHEISLMDIVAALEGPGHMDRCVVGIATCDERTACPLHDLFRPIRQRLKDYLATTTLADLGASLRSNPAWQHQQQQPRTERVVADTKERRS
jgi:Rrf2 family transcriptional regulator, iron-sulfur cluster assembly transcription factor